MQKLWPWTEWKDKPMIVWTYGRKGENYVCLATDSLKLIILNFDQMIQSECLTLYSMKAPFDALEMLCFCLIWFFRSHQQSFGYKGTGLPGLNQY